MKRFNSWGWIIRNWRQGLPLVWAGFTLILLGYLTVWLPGPGAGLTLIGVEVGEWVKFLPAFQSGELGPREWFYLPPVLLGGMMALITTEWPNRRWQSWGMRGLALFVALLAFPALEAIRDEPSSEWLLRLVWIGVVGLVALLSGVMGRWNACIFLAYAFILIAAVLNIWLPTSLLMQVRPVVSFLMGVPLSVGVGAWLNGAGSLLVMAGVGLLLREKIKTRLPEKMPASGL